MRYVDGKILGKNGPKKALVCSSHEWDSLLSRITEGRQLQERNEEKIAREERKKELSKTMTVKWPNTLANMQKKRERLLIDAAEKAENDKLKEYNDILARRAQEKETMLENARKLVMERTESSRTLNAGLILSEILHERDKQVEIRKIQRWKLKEQEMEETRRKMKLAEAFQEDQINEKINHLQTLENYKRSLDEQMVEVQAMRQLEQEEKMREKEDLVEIARELAQQQETEKIESEKRKNKLKEEQTMWKQLELEVKEKLLQEEKEQREINDIYQTVRDRLNKERDELEKKIRKDTVEKRGKFAAAHLIPKIDFAKEEQLLEKALKEKDEKLKQQDQLKIRKKEILRKELQEFKKEAAQLMNEREFKIKELNRWDKLKRLAIEESTKKYQEKMWEEKKEKQRACREMLLEQWEEREEREKREKWDDMTIYENEKIQEQNALIKLCKEVEKTCIESGRPIYPVLAAIAKVKKLNGIKEKDKQVPFLQSKVPIPSVGLYEIDKNKN